MPVHGDVNGVPVEFIGWSEEKTDTIYSAGENYEEKGEVITSLTITEDTTVYAVWGYDSNRDGTPDALQVLIRPADMTIYTGGEGYLGTVEDTDGNTVDTVDSGLPEPGFYFTLPYDMNQAVKQASGAAEDEAVNLTGYLTITARTNEGEERSWSVRLYDPAAGHNSAVGGRYVYSFEVPDTQDPVRLQFTDEEGNIVISDEFDVSDALYQTYSMGIYKGAVSGSTVQATVTIQEQEYAASVGSEDGTLTVRGVTGEEVLTEIADNINGKVDEITAAVSGDVPNYYINGSKILVGDQESVRLLADEIVDSELEDGSYTHEKLLEIAGDNVPDYGSRLEYEFKYLDLVDTSNGNVWVTMGDQDTLTVYWPYPSGTGKNDEFTLIHYKGLDREFDLNEIENQSVETEIYSTENGTLECTDYGIKLTVSSFSPFVLIWEKNSSSGGGTTYYTLHYESNGGTAYEDTRHASGTVVELDKIPVREGYTFTGWYADEDLTEPVTSVQMTSSKTVYAGWEITGVPEWLNGDDHFAYVVGYPDGTVQPLSSVTRAEVATIFFRLLTDEVREEYLTETNNFADVNPDDWYNTAISTMAAMGVLKGRTSSEFAPDEPITRAEFAAICARFDTGLTDGDSNFTDIAGHWAESEIERAAMLGWITGYTDGTFRPENQITRAEAVTMINRVLQRLPENEEDLLEDMNIWPDNASDAWYYIAVQEATNSHDFERKDDGVHETWTALEENPDWTEYE